MKHWSWLVMLWALKLTAASPATETPVPATELPQGYIKVYQPVDTYLEWEKIEKDHELLWNVMWSYTDHSTRVRQTENRYHVVMMDPYREGEDTFGGDEQVVRYFNDADRAEIEITVLPDGSLRYLQSGEKLADISYNVIVMDNAGRIYVIKKYVDKRKWRLQHSSVLAGEPVAFAGYLTVDADGFITVLDNYSGHYMPAPLALAQVLAEFKRRGARLDLMKLQFAVRSVGMDDAWFPTDKMPYREPSNKPAPAELLDADSCVRRLAGR